MIKSHSEVDERYFSISTSKWTVDTKEDLIKLLQDFEDRIILKNKQMTDQQRKERPVYSGVIKYFPRALMEVAYCSFIANEQHNPGEPMYWAKEKSPQEMDSLIRHAIDDILGVKEDSDGILHLAKVAWRALANLERELESTEKGMSREELVKYYSRSTDKIPE